MSTECFPITVLPHISALYREYLATGDSAASSPVRRWYGAEPFAGKWIGKAVGVVDAARLADALEQQSVELGAGAAAMANIARLRAGARAVVTGQQVGLFGGPLLTLLKAATAIARAKQATAATGIDHVPVFWLATEDHDLAEVDHVALLSKTSVETLRAELKTSGAVPVGVVALGAEMDAVLDQASELLTWAPISDVLRECYAARDGYEPTLGGAFARLMARVFAAEGLIVMDAAGRAFHALGASTLRYAIEHADALHEALVARTAELEAGGFHAQVLVAAGSSLLFLVDASSGERLALRRSADGAWKAGGKVYSTADLLAILAAEPERISPNALLRPVFQDTILPTAAYVGGPAEIAYFAQSAVLYEAILGRITPVLPRLSATLIEPAIATVMDRHEVSLPDAMATAEALAQRLGARAMPIEGKRKLAAVGKAMDAELAALTEYLGAMDASLGKSAEVSGNKMRYQMNRLRRIAATFELQKEASLRKHAEALTLHLFPGGHPQERTLGGVWFLARYGDGLIERLVTEAENLCPGHVVVRL
ncbi:bacillithiol biosynthesis cysteine-adding enzyme BshC [Granulicella arctica]|uniref:Putative cysteine ligase BshC n=1 Tax=Granulicella arctica TaxID=940613 RepID=A0A7Y9PJT0_9BACT|nr:bacillithiol biosynthesis cysteine-adding enzyme BshC [Granulicella arctica]NYF81152.1 bacillithiol biosynthesis cysteine-adding enzyme BshC [Granulicella arctica]